MATFIDFSFAAEEKRRQRRRAEEKAEVERVDALIATEEQRREQLKAIRHQGNDELHQPTLRLDKSLPPTPHTVTRIVYASHGLGAASVAAAPATAEQGATLTRLGKWQRVKEFLDPGLRRQRIAEEFALSQRIGQQVEEPVEPPSLPGAGLQKLREREEKPLPASPIDEEFDANMTRGGDDDEITALPCLPGYRYQAPAGPSVPQEPVDEPSIEDLADQAMKEAETAYDAPGNRSSTRSPLPAGWVANEPEVSKRAGNSGIEQRMSPMYTAFTPLPDVLSMPGSPLPSVSVQEGRPTRAQERGERSLRWCAEAAGFREVARRRH